MESFLVELSRVLQDEQILIPEIGAASHASSDSILKSKQMSSWPATGKLDDFSPTLQQRNDHELTLWRHARENL
jgi:hypothetical protein